MSKESVIPDKLYFKIGEVSKILGIKPYVLRYWETEFREISPIKSRTNQRLYKRKDVELVLKIKQLLYDERFTINGAKKRLKLDKREVKDPSNSIDASQLGLDFKDKGSVEKNHGNALLYDQLKSRLIELKQEMHSSLR